MGFAIFAEKEHRRGNAPGGRYRRAAVGCWFTSEGKSIPKLVKFQDDSGCLQMIRDIQVLQSEKKYCGGSPVQEYRCRGVLEEQELRFFLFYHAGSGTWDMLPGEDYFLPYI